MLISESSAEILVSEVKIFLCEVYIYIKRYMKLGIHIINI